MASLREDLANASEVRPPPLPLLLFIASITVESHCLCLLIIVLGRNGSENHYFGLKTPINGSIKQLYQAETDRRRPEIWTPRTPPAGPRERGPRPRQRGGGRGHLERDTRR